MLSRINSFWLILFISIAAVAGLGALMLWKETGKQAEPLVVYCAAALSEPMKEIASLYEQEKGVPIELRFGKSEEILASMKLTKQGDVFLPADDSYIDKARNEGLLGDIFPLAKMNAALVVNPQFAGGIASWDDLFKEGNAKLAIASEGAAVRELTKKHLPAAQWGQLEKHSAALGSVTEVANAIKLGGAVNAGIIWDSMVTSPNYSMLKIIKLKELEGITANVKIAVVKSSSRTESLGFTQFVSGSCADIFQRYGFTGVGIPAALSGRKLVVTSDSFPPGHCMEKQSDKNPERPEILVYAGAMLRPAVEETIKEFEKREGVTIITVYNGCGILVSQMKTGQRPDLYFSCDPTFMNQVSDLFESPKVVSKNRLVIAVKKGNPHGIAALKDLAKDGLKVGVGHEQQCALGAITQGVLIRSKLNKALENNIVVRVPSGDLLINQLRTGSLDAVVAYISNVTPYENELEAIPLHDVNCTPSQPIAIGRNTTHHDVVKRLIKAIESAESKSRFEKLGFGWEVAP